MAKAPARSAPPAKPKSVACQTCPDKKKPPKKVITVRASLFFDGTLNNRTNTDARLAYEARKRKGEKVRSPGSGSYENDWSNVAKLEQVLADDQPGYDHALKLYVEGIGTTNNKSDTNLPGAAFGRGDTGVPAKVASGLTQIIPQIAALVDDPATTRIAHVHLDSFGFSRGAAAARLFIHEAIKAGPNVIKKALAARGIDVGTVKMRFCGLFDTVASYGTDHTDDTKQLHLNAVSMAEKCIQLAAAEEHRVNFPLTNIKSAGSGRQIYLPGVHSDVGGGYTDHGSETDLQVFDIDTAWKTKAEEAALTRERNWMIQQGWYRADELKPTNYWNEIRATRTGIRNTYARIPLQMQAKFAKQLQLRFQPTLEDRHAVPADLKAMEARINGEMATSPGRYFHRVDPALAQLRHDHLHFSAYYGSISNAPLWTGDDPIRGMRTRAVHDG